MSYGWIQAMDEALATSHIGVADKSDSYDTAKRKLEELIDWHVAVALDERVNGGYRLVPVEPTEDMVEQSAQAIVSWDEGCTWPDSWGADSVRHRKDARKAYQAMLAAAPSPDGHNA